MVFVWQTDARPSENREKNRQVIPSFARFLMPGKELNANLSEISPGFPYFKPGSSWIPQHQKVMLPPARRQGLQAVAAHSEKRLSGRWMFDDYRCYVATDLPVSQRANWANWGNLQKVLGDTPGFSTNGQKLDSVLQS